MLISEDSCHEARVVCTLAAGRGAELAYLIIRPGAERDVEASVRLVVALGAGEEDA